VSALRTDIPKPPKRMAKLPIDHRGYPVPKFVWRNPADDQWDFRVVDPGWMDRCLRFRVCWLCGEKLGSNMVFVVGPMCVVNRASGEPPCHHECAQYAAKACPFMVNPDRPRNDKKALPKEGAFNENHLDRNPGATALYITRSYDWNSRDGVISMGEPVRIEWWCRGRTATRAEIDRSIETGLPLLRAVAQEEGTQALAQLDKMIERAQPWLPA